MNGKLKRVNPTKKWYKEFKKQFDALEKKEILGEAKEVYGFKIPTKKAKAGTKQIVERFLNANRKLIDDTDFGREYTTREAREKGLAKIIKNYRKNEGLTVRQALLRVVSSTYAFKNEREQAPINFIEGLKHTPCHNYKDEPVEEYSSYEYACYLLSTTKTTVAYLSSDKVTYKDGVWTYDNEIEFELSGGKGESTYFLIRRV